MYFSVYCGLWVHAGASNLTVIRAARRKLKKPVRRSRKHRTERHLYYRAMLAEHASARDLYNVVISGRI